MIPLADVDPSATIRILHRGSLVGESSVPTLGESQDFKCAIVITLGA